jgi:hypothetical protein
MVHIDSESKRFKNAIRFFTYGVMTTAIVALSAIVILLALGYRFNTNGVVRDGLVQLAAHPEDAQYTVNDKTYKGTTPAKLTLRAGSYAISLSRAGYRTWQRELNVIEGHVHWINYPRLVPNTLTAKNDKSFANASFAVASPDKRWLLVDTGEAPKNRLLLVDLKDPKKTEQLTLTIPADQLTKKGDNEGELTFGEWSLDSKQFIVKHVVTDTTEYVRVDRSKPQNAVNINKKFQLAVDQAHFSGNDNNIIYARTGDVLRRFDVSGDSTTGSLMSGVKDFEVYGSDTVIFDRVTKGQEADQPDQSSQEVGMRVKDKEYILQNLPASDDVTPVYNEYDHHSYFAIANRTKNETTIYQDPTNQSDGHLTPFGEFTNIAATYIRFNGDGRFLLVQQGNNFGVYDFYENQKFSYQVMNLDVSAPAKWLDDFHINGVINGKLTMWDFDGTNAQSLVNGLPGLDSILDEDDDLLYTFTAQKNGQKTQVELTRTDMKAPKQ